MFVITISHKHLVPGREVVLVNLMACLNPVKGK